MSLFRVEIQVLPAVGDMVETMSVLVDTGASYRDPTRFLTSTWRTLCIGATHEAGGTGCPAPMVSRNVSV